VTHGHNPDRVTAASGTGLGVDRRSAVTQGQYVLTAYAYGANLGAAEMAGTYAARSPHAAEPPASAGTDRSPARRSARRRAPSNTAGPTTSAPETHALKTSALLDRQQGAHHDVTGAVEACHPDSPRGDQLTDLECPTGWDWVWSRSGGRTSAPSRVMFSRVRARSPAPSTRRRR
jgi:hypothetical protein